MRSFYFFPYLLFLFSTVFASSFISFSQKNEELVLHKIDEQNGLSDNNVQCTYKDKNNFVWIGTESGLDLMDGSDITVFKHEIGNPNSIANNNISAITSDPNGLLWIGNDQGVNSFDKTNNKFAFYPLNLNETTSNNHLVSCLLADDSGNIYIGTGKGLFFLDHKHGKIKRIQIPGDKFFSEDNNITHLVDDHSGKVWITTFDGLWSYDMHQNRFLHEVNEKNDPQFTGLFVYSIIDHEGKLWIGTWDKGLKKFDPISKAITTYPVINNQAISLAEIRQPNGNYLICINGYFLAFDPMIHEVISLPVTPAFSKTPLVNNLYTSDDNWLWIGTHQGLYFYNPAKSLFRHHRFPDLITSQGVALLQWNDKILVSGRSDNFLKEYNTNLEETADYSRTMNKKDISCLYLKISGTNSVKAGTSKGIADINLLRKTVKLTTLNFLTKKFYYGNFITCLLPDENHKWWVFPWRLGIWQTDSSNQNLHQVFNNFIKQNGSPKPLVIADAVEDKNGNVWMADLDEGIIFYNRQTNTFSKPFLKVFGDRITMSQILYCRDKCYSFSGSEVYEWNCENPQLHKISLLSQNDKPISSLAIDSIGNLWLATKKGLLAYNFKSGIVDRFTTADGLITNEIDATLMCMSEGRIVIGSGGYLSSFDPSMLLSSVGPAPHIQLSLLTANGRVVTPDSASQMTFGHMINNFILKWTITDYNNPENNHFYYRLKGIDNEWHYVGNRGQVEFANLSAGKYTILLKAENSNGVIADKILSVSLSILLPFWKTWWFFVLVFCVILIFFYSLYRYRLNQALKFQKLRNKISLDLHDDIGSTLSSISILSEIALNEDKPANTNKMLQEIKENSLSLMERMDDIVWSINPHNDSLESLFLRIKVFASRLFEAKEINYSIQIDEKIKYEQLQMEYRQHIYLILKEAINNLVKYSECTEAKIIVHYTGSHLSILINDNGKGFEFQKGKYGNGLSSIKQRAADMHADVKITSKINKGTTIFLSVKIK